MTKKLLSALILIAIVVIVLLLNGGDRITVTFRLFDLAPPRSVVLFSFTAIGVVIGLLLK
jgi:uncharacterized integral membrane protein